MEEMTELVWTNMEQAQSQQKTWYDKSARQRILQPGQKVLLLLPTSENKLLAKIDLPGRRKPRQTFHVNLLKEWHREATGTAAQGAGCGRGGGSVSPDLPPAEGEFCLLAFSKKGWGSRPLWNTPFLSKTLPLCANGCTGFLSVSCRASKPRWRRCWLWG